MTPCKCILFANLFVVFFGAKVLGQTNKDIYNIVIDSVYSNESNGWYQEGGIYKKRHDLNDSTGGIVLPAKFFFERKYMDLDSDFVKNFYLKVDIGGSISFNPLDSSNYLEIGKRFNVTNYEILSDDDFRIDYEHLSIYPPYNYNIEFRNLRVALSKIFMSIDGNVAVCVVSFSRGAAVGSHWFYFVVLKSFRNSGWRITKIDFINE